MTPRPFFASLALLAALAQAASASVTITLSGGPQADQDARLQAARQEVSALLGSEVQPKADAEGSIRFSAPAWASAGDERTKHVEALKKAWGQGVAISEDPAAPASVKTTVSHPLAKAAAALSFVPASAVAGQGEAAYDGASLRPRSAALPAVAAAPAAVAKTAKQAPASPAEAPLSKASASGLDLAAIDRSASPCQDFYRYACGSWIDHNPIPDDKTSWGRFSAIQERNLSILKDILQKAQRKTRRMAEDDRKIGDYYAACMDEKGADKKGIKALRPQLSGIAALRGPRDLPRVLARLDLTGATVPPGGRDEEPDAVLALGSEQDYQDATRMIAGIQQGSLSLPDRSYYLEDHYAADRAAFLEHMRAMFALAGDSPKEAQAEAARALALETSLARISLERKDTRDPKQTNHKMALADFEALTPSFDWTAYFRALGAPRFDVLNVDELPYFQKLEPILAGTPAAAWRSYLRWRVIHAHAGMLSSAFVDENFAFYGKRLTGQKAQTPRWKKCIGQVDAALGDALGREYVKRAFGGQSKQEALGMIEGIEGAMRENIMSSSWMSATTQKKALEKLSLVANRIGYPDKWKDYSSLTVRPGDAVGNDERAALFSARKGLAKIGRPFDRNDWHMTPPTVNAYYDPGMNGINFPAGILQSPFFDASHDDAVNFGAIGAVEGHELTHGFDNQGHQYDGRGNFVNWWTQSDEKAFETRSQSMVDEYDKFVVQDVHVRGDATLGENIADNGGARLAYEAYMKKVAQQGGGRMLDGYTPSQRFFLAFGQDWCENQRPETERLQTVNDEHTVNKYRVMGVLSNMPEFAQAFQCKAGDAMVNPNPARVW